MFMARFFRGERHIGLRHSNMFTRVFFAFRMRHIKQPTLNVPRPMPTIDVADSGV
jgi:hypothetical protein